MKFGYLAVAASVLLPGVAHGETVWLGGAVLTSVTGCGTNYRVGEPIPMRYYPANLAGNDGYSKIAFHSTYYAQSFAYNGKFPNVLTAVIGGRTVSGTGAFSVTPKLKMTSITPANYTATTPSLALVGEIQNFKDISGCNVSFRASATLGAF